LFFYINIFLEAPGIILHRYMQMDTAQLIGTFNYYVNGPGNQNNYVFSQKDDSVLKGP